MSEVILREELPKQVRSELFGIQTAGRNLLSVVSDILDFSELQSGKMELIEVSYNITSTINDIVNMLMEALDGEVEGMAIVMKGTHLCKTMRGVKNNGQMSVAHLTGVFQSNGEARREFYKLIELQH